MLSSPNESIWSDEDVEFLAKCDASTPFYLRAFYPDIFYRSFGKAHEAFFEVFDDPSIKKIVATAWRGFGKSALFSFGLPSKAILFQSKKFIVNIGHNSDDAVARASSLKNILMTNEMVRAYFGPLRPSTLTDDSFSTVTWVTSTGIKVLPRGRGQPVRGATHRVKYRPDLVLLDDLEDPKEVLSEQQRKEMWTWVMTDVCNSINRGDEGQHVEEDGYDNTQYKIVVIGTPLYQDSVIPKLIDLAGEPGEGKEWTKVEIKLCDDNRKSFWVDWMSDASVERLYKEHEERDALDEFEREFRCQFMGPDTARFKHAHMRYYHSNVEYGKECLKRAGLWKDDTIIIEIKEEDINRNPYCYKFVQIDPARCSLEKSNYTAITGLAADLETNRILVREIKRERFTPDELYDEGISMCLRQKAHVIAPEVTGLGEHITYPLDNAIRRRTLSAWIRVVELKARNKNKGVRALATLSFFKEGLVYINAEYAYLLVPNLLLVPLNAEWDVIDSTVYFPQTLEIEGKYMMSDIEVADDDDDDDLDEDEEGDEEDEDLVYEFIPGV